MDRNEEETKLVDGSYVYLAGGAESYGGASEKDENDMQSQQKAAFQNSFSLAASRKQLGGDIVPQADGQEREHTSLMQQKFGERGSHHQNTKFEKFVAPAEDDEAEDAYEKKIREMNKALK